MRSGGVGVSVAFAHQGCKDNEETTMTVKDPVCGMEIEEGDAVGSAEHEGKTFFFCSNDCKEEFEADPDAYTG